MPYTPFTDVASMDGPRITVSDYLKDPLRIPALILDMMQNEFIIDSILRNAGNNESGAVRFEQSTPLFADHDPDIRAEFAEVRAVQTSVGPLNVAYSFERAMAITVSDAMRRRQIVDPVNRQLLQVKNSMVRAWNVALFALFDAVVAANQTYAIPAGSEWDNTKSYANVTGASVGNMIRSQISDAVYIVENAVADIQSGTTPNYFGFEPDTLIINHTAKLALFKSADFAKPYIGDAATASIQYTGLMPQKVMNLDVFVSRQCPIKTAYILQRNRCGFISDEVPQTASPLYRDEPRKCWRSDVQRAAALGIDQPKAIVRLTNVTATDPFTAVAAEL